MPNELKIFSGTAHPCWPSRSATTWSGARQGPGVQVQQRQHVRQYQENIRAQDVFIIQPFAYPVNDRIMELLIMIDAARGRPRVA